MADIGRNDGAPAGDFIPHEFRRAVLALRHKFHLGRDFALAGVVHLADIPAAVFHPFGADRLQALFNGDFRAFVRVRAGGVIDGEFIAVLERDLAHRHAVFVNLARSRKRPACDMGAIIFVVMFGHCYSFCFLRGGSEKRSFL